jgi:hypothetical protein
MIDKLHLQKYLEVKVTLSIGVCTHGSYDDDDE